MSDQGQHPSDAPLATSWQVASSMAGKSIAGVLLMTFLAWLSMGPSLDLLPDVEEESNRLLAALLIVLLAEAFVSTAWCIVRLRPLRKWLQSHTAAPHAEQRDLQPLPQRHVVEAFRAPFRYALAPLVLTVALLVSESWLLLLTPGLAPHTRLAALLYLFAFVLGFIQLRIIAWRSGLWLWLSRINPAVMSMPTKSSLKGQTQLRIIVPAEMIGLGASAVVLAHLLQHGVHPWVGAACCVGALVVIALSASWLSRRMAQVAASDLRALSFRVSVLATATSDPSIQEATAALVRPCKTKEASLVAHAVQSLSFHFHRRAREEHQAKVAIEEAQRMKTRLMVCMSHDLRSPLNSIRGFTSLLLQETDGPLNASQHESVHMIQQSGHELLTLVGDILDWARLDAGQLALYRAWTPVVELITSAVERCEHTYGYQKLDERILVNIQPGLPPVFVDAERIAQAITGVLRHVLVMLPASAPVTIRAMLQDAIPARAVARSHALDKRWHEAGRPFLQLDIVDEASGLRTADREQIFLAFRNMRTASGQRSGGLGLGLAVARSLLVAHQGELWYEWRRPGGTIFCMAMEL